MKSSISKSLTGVAGAVVLLALLVVANALAARLRVRVDLTADRLYTLSDGTKQMLAGLDRDVTLKFYRTRNAEGLPAAFNQYADRILDLLREYEALGRGRVALQAVDPQPDSEHEEWAEKYGLAGTQIDPQGRGPAVYLGLVALAGARQEAIPFFSPADEPQLEYLVTRLVGKVTAARKPKIGVLSALPVLGQQPTMMSQGRGGDAWIVAEELKNQYDVTELPGLFDEVPEDVDTVLAIHPRGISEIALFALDQFVLRGGRLIAFVDPLSLVEQELQPRGMRDPFGTRSDLNRLTSAWGITMEADRVVADAKAATPIRMQNGALDRNLAWLTLRAENLNRDELATAGLEAMMLPMAGAFRGTPVEGITLTPLITASPGAGLMTPMEATMGAMAGTTTLQRQADPLHLAVRLSGRFKTAFPDGRPADPDRPADQPRAPERKAHLAESAKDGVVVLVGDADLLYDAYAVRRLSVFGRPVYQLANDNITFVANLAGQLSGGDSLIGLRSRGAYDRPFTRVLDLQKEAQEAWRQKELALQEQLRLTEMKLRDLEVAKDPEQRLVVTAAQKQEIAQFQQQLVATRRQLKDVRKNLRSEIEALGLRIKVLNLAAMPALVIAFGLAHGLLRRRRARNA